MLSYLRFFTLISLLAMVVVAGAVGGFFHTQAQGALRELGQQTNIAVARHFNVDIWARHRETLAKSEIAPALADDMQRFITYSQVKGVRLYGRDGALLYTTGGTTHTGALLADAQAAKASPIRVASSLSGSQSMVPGKDPLLVRSVIVMGPNDGEALLELFTDVSVPNGQFLLLLVAVVISIVLTVLGMLVVMSIVYRKSESVIARQHEKVMEMEAVAASAQEATRQKSQFLASISHELRTPLNAIIGFSDIIKNEMMGEVKNAQFAGYMNDIHSSGVHLLSLINDILDYSKAEAGKLELEVEEVNATKLAVNCLRLVQPRAETAGVELVNGLPKEHFVLETDGKKFKQVLLNLLSNAVKFTPSGGKVRITGWQDLTADTYVFQVVDTGIGMAQKDIAKAMAAFGQVDNALSRKYEGTGLGLPLTKKFVELMGGKFGLQSELNVGTTITFSLPRTFKGGEGIVVKKTI